MELLHRQEELEHAELERALMLSLIAEEERLTAMMIDAKASPDDHTYAVADKKDSDEVSDSKGVADKATTSAKDSGEAKKTPKKLPATSSSSSTLPDSFADIKPLKLKTDLKPLPSIKATSSSSNSSEMVQDLLEKKKVTEATIKKGYEQLQGQRKNEEELKQKLDPSEIERRERHMKEQRDLLIAKKKEERERKVRAEEERKRKIAAGEAVDADDKGSGSPTKFAALANDSKGNGAYPSNDDIAEMRRSTMRMALARRLKMDLMESEEAKRNEIQETQFAELDKKLQQVEQLREDNRKREYILNKQIEKQQEQIARNIELSAAMMSRNQRDD